MYLATVIWFSVVLNLSDKSCYGEIRNKRFLIFPQGNPTRHQFIAGVGIPIDLRTESIAIGYVFKAQYYLPYNVSQLRPTVLTSERKKRNYDQIDQITGQKYERYEAEVEEIPEEITTEPDQEQKDVVLNGRWLLYKQLEHVMESYGYPGRSCMLRSICEAADVKFRASNGLLDELFHIIFTPSSTNEQSPEHTNNEYLRAEQLGLTTHSSCHIIFKECNKSIMKLFTRIFDPITRMFDL